MFFPSYVEIFQNLALPSCSGKLGELSCCLLLRRPQRLFEVQTLSLVIRFTPYLEFRGLNSSVERRRPPCSPLHTLALRLRKGDFRSLHLLICCLQLEPTAMFQVLPKPKQRGQREAVRHFSIPERQQLLNVIVEFGHLR